MDYVDRLLLHRPDVLFDPNELKEALDQLFSEGLIKDFGVSNMSMAQMRLFEKVTGKKVNANQLELSLKHNQFASSWVDFNTENFIKDELNGTIEHCMINDIEVQAWGSMAQGRYSGRSMPDMTKADMETCELVKQLAEDKNASMENIVLEWLLKHPAKIKPVIGTTNTKRINDLKGIEDMTLSRQEWYSLLQASRGVPLP